MYIYIYKYIYMIYIYICILSPSGSGSQSLTSSCHIASYSRWSLPPSTPRRRPARPHCRRPRRQSSSTKQMQLSLQMRAIEKVWGSHVPPFFERQPDAADSTKARIKKTTNKTNWQLTSCKHHTYIEVHTPKYNVNVWNVLFFSPNPSAHPPPTNKITGYFCRVFGDQE